MKKITDWLIKSGLWIPPIIFVGTWVFFLIKNPAVLHEQRNIYLMVLGSFAPLFFIWMDNLGHPKADKAWSGKQQAMYPPVAEQLLFKNPTGIVFGKDRKTGRYVCKLLSLDGHLLLIGGSGSGKSSGLAIPTLLVNSSAHFFVIDIKGELSYKSRKLDDPTIIIFNPLNRDSWGYNPLYRLRKDSSGQEIYEVMQLITFSLIPLPADVKDPFWKTSARNLLLGQLIYFFKEGFTEFVDIIDQILSRPMKDTVDEVMQRASPESVEYRTLVGFSKMADDTLGGIIGEVNNHIALFVNDQDIRYAFKTNPNKFNPLMLEDQSIFLSIAEHKLSAYYDVMQLIINQTLAQLELRPEKSDPIVVMLDELPRILSSGKIDRLLDGARTLRSRSVSLCLITQSTEALMSAFTESEVDDLISNCSYTLVLDAKSKKTQQTICNWCGKYRVQKHSWNGSGSKAKISTNFDEKDIVEPADLMNLQRTGEAILISPYGYNRIKKAPYFKDKYLKAKADEVKKYNDALTNQLTKEENNNEQQQ